MIENHINFTKDWFYLLILGLIIFILLKWIYSKLTKNKRLKIILTTLSTIILTPIVYNILIIILISFLFYEYHPEREFKQESWIENINDRHEMTKDLIETNIIKGKSKDQVIELLGKPFNDFNLQKDSTDIWAYNLGSEGHGMGWKFHSLILKFENEKVASIKTEIAID